MSTTSLVVQETLNTGRAKSRRGTGWGFGLSLSVLIAIALVAILADWIMPFDPMQVDLRAINAAPGTNGHLLGTDQNGRDILSRLIAASRISLISPLIVSVASAVVGVLVGAISAWQGGWIDMVISRIVDFFFAFPGLLVAVFAVALFGRGIVAPVIALSIAMAPMGARLARNLVLQELSKDYVRALTVLGYSGPIIFFRHVFPNIAPPIMSQTILGFSYAVVNLAAVSYLGLGVQPPAADWGLMISEGQSSLLQGAPWPVLWPSLIIVIVVIAYNYIGEHFVDRYGRKVDA